MAVLAGITIAVLVRDVLLLGFIGVLLSVLLAYPVGFLARWIPRGAATVLVLVLLIGTVGGLSAVTVPRVSEQVQSAMGRLPAAVRQIDEWLSHLRRSSAVGQLTRNPHIAAPVGERLGKLVDAGAKAMVPAAKNAIALMVALILIFVLAAFLVFQPESYRRGARRLIPRRHKEAFDETYIRLGQGLRRWLGGILVAMTLMGAIAMTGLAIAGINDWFLLGALTFSGTFVPYLGAIASAIPGLLIALSQSPRHFVYACIVYLVVHLLEGYFVQPMIMKKAVELKPAVLLFGQALLGTLFGVLGIVVAAPLLICVQVALEYLYVERGLEEGA